MADQVDKKKYNYMENVLQYIIKTNISLSTTETKKNNETLSAIVNEVINNLKLKSHLFKTLYQQLFYGGSYYDGLKIGKPEEYDLDLLLVLDKTCILEPIADIPGFVTLKFPLQTSEMKELMTDTYLSTDKVLKWMESNTTKALQEFEAAGTQYLISVNDKKYYIKIVKSGPAFTMKIQGDSTTDIQHFDVDLVPCFKFGPVHWPKGGFRQNKVPLKPDFFIVPKNPKKCADAKFKNISWRLSFQIQEREMINGFNTLKPAIKLLKQLRDKLQHKCISSYFIKTVFLWAVNSRPKEFWGNSLSYVFMEMLEAYAACLARGEILYYWNKNNNLLSNIPKITMENYSNRVGNIINEFKKGQVASYFISNEEVDQMEIIIGKKKCIDAEIVTIKSDTRNIHANIAELNINTIKDENDDLKKMVQDAIQLLINLNTKVDNLIVEVNNLKKLHHAGKINNELVDELAMNYKS